MEAVRELFKRMLPSSWRAMAQLLRLVLNLLVVTSFWLNDPLTDVPYQVSCISDIMIHTSSEIIVMK